MANIRSQIKRNRQNEVRRLRNKGVRSEARTQVKKALEAASAGDRDLAMDLLRQAQKRIDLAAAKGVLHPNTAARRKARLVKQIEQRLA